MLLRGRDSSQALVSSEDMSIGSSGRGWGSVSKDGCSSGRPENRTATTLRAPAIVPCDLYGLHLGARRSPAPFLKALGEAFHMGRTRTDGSRADGRKNAEELAPLGEMTRAEVPPDGYTCNKRALFKAARSTFLPPDRK